MLRRCCQMPMRWRPLARMEGFWRMDETLIRGVAAKALELAEQYYDTMTRNTKVSFEAACSGCPRRLALRMSRSHLSHRACSWAGPKSWMERSHISYFICGVARELMRAGNRTVLRRPRDHAVERCVRARSARAHGIRAPRDGRRINQRLSSVAAERAVPDAVGGRAADPRCARACLPRGRPDLVQRPGWHRRRRSWCLCKGWSRCGGRMRRGCLRTR